MGDPLAEQIRWEVTRRLRLLRGLCPSLSMVEAFIGDGPEAAADRIWADDLGALAAMRILEGLWPEPTTPPPWWWRTPLGWSLAWHLDGEHPEWFHSLITIKEALELTGVSRSHLRVLNPPQGRPPRTMPLSRALKAMIRYQPEVWAAWERPEPDLDDLSAKIAETLVDRVQPVRHRRVADPRSCVRCGREGYSKIDRSTPWYCPPCWEDVKALRASRRETV